MYWNQMTLEVAKEHQARLLDEVKGAPAGADTQTDLRNHRMDRQRFFVLYRVRSLLFRLAPRLAANLSI